MEVTVITIVIRALVTVTQGRVKKTGGITNKRKREGHSDSGIVETGQNNVKNFRGMRRLAATQTLLKTRKN